MTKPLKEPKKTSQRPLFLRKKLCFTPKTAEKPSKTPPAVDYRGTFRQKKYAVKEPDPETGLYYYGSRYLDPKTSRWISGDPALGDYLPSAPLGDEEKRRNSNLPGQGGVFNYVNLHVYHYAGNNPVKYVDPDGRESITVSGSPGNHNNKRHFLENGLDRAIKAKTHFQRNGETSTWIIYNDKKNGYSADLIEEYTQKAAKEGITVNVVSDVSEIVNYVNSKNGGNTRAVDKITSFYYVGHATPGDLKVGYLGTGQDFDPSDFKANAFSSGTYVDVVGGCRTSIGWGLFGIFDPSIIKQFAKILDKKSEIHGANVRVWYDGGVVSNKQLLRPNSGREVIINGKL